MIHFITGKPGGGKSLLAVRQLINELATSNRDVVTNLPIRREILSEYLQRKYPDRHIPLLGPDNRLTLLDEGKEVRTLYKRYRDEYQKARKHHASQEVLEAIYLEMEKAIGDLEIPVQTAKFWEYRNPRKKRFDEAVGTLFVLDEVHLYFNARKWQETGEEGLRYLSQHRHFSDDVILVTQHADNVDGQFRRLVEDWSVIKNGYTQKLGWFRALPRFTRSVYTSQPTGGVKQTPFERTSFTLDAKGIAATYNTASAAGVMANGADTGRKPRGLHPAWFMVMVLVGALSLGALIKLANKFATDKVIGKLPADKKAAVVDTPRNDNFAVDRGRLQNEQLDTNDLPLRSPGQTPGVDREPVRMRGYAARGGKVNVVMSDGRTMTESDQIFAVTRNSVTIGDEKFYMMQPHERPAVPAQPVKEAVTSDTPAPALPDPPKPAESAWATHADGVQRLKETPSLVSGLDFKR